MKTGLFPALGYQTPSRLFRGGMVNASLSSDNSGVMFSGNRRPHPATYESAESLRGLCEQLGQTHAHKRFNSLIERIIEGLKANSKIAPEDRIAILTALAPRVRRSKHVSQVGQLIRNQPESPEKVALMAQFFAPASSVKVPSKPVLETKEQLLAYFPEMVKQFKRRVDTTFFEALGKLPEMEQMEVIATFARKPNPHEITRALIDAIDKFQDPFHKAYAWRSFEGLSDKLLVGLIREKAKRLKNPVILADIVRTFPQDTDESLLETLKSFVSQPHKERLRALSVGETVFKRPDARFTLAKTFATDSYLAVGLKALSITEGIKPEKRLDAMRADYLKAFARSPHAQVRFVALLRASSLAGSDRLDTLKTFAQNPDLMLDMKPDIRHKTQRLFFNHPEVLPFVADEDLKSQVLRMLAASKEMATLHMVLDQSATLKQEMYRMPVLKEVIHNAALSKAIQSSGDFPRLWTKILASVEGLTQDNLKSLGLVSLMTHVVAQSDSPMDDKGSPITLPPNRIVLPKDAWLAFQAKALAMETSIQDDGWKAKACQAFVNMPLDTLQKALAACTGITDPHALASLVSTFAHNPDEQIMSLLQPMILALKKSSQQEFATALISLAKNPNEAARSFAVGQIKSVSSGPQKAAVIQAYLGDPSDAVRGITEQAYQENNTSDTFRLNMAVAASNNPNPVVRNTGFCNLWVVKDEHAVAQALRYYIDDPDKDIRATAVQMVSIFERQSLKASMLKPFLFDSDPEIVELAREKAMEMAPKWRDEVLSVLAPPEETVKKAEPVSERKPVKPTAPTVVRPDVQVAGPVKHGYRLDYMFQSAQTQLQEAAQGFAANQVYDPAIFMCRPTQSKRNWLFRRDDAGQPAVYEPIMNSDLRNLSKLLKLPQGYPGIEPLEGIYIFRGYQERFTRGGMGAYHILFNHGPNPFPVGGQELAPLNGDKDYSQFVTPEGEAASVDQISEMVRKALNEGSLLRLKVGKRKLVYFKLKGDKEKQKNRFYTVTMEYAYPDGRQIGRDIRTGVPYYKMHVVLGVYPGSNKAFLYTAFPTNGTVNIPPQLRQVVAEARHRRQAVKAAASLKSESPV